MTTLYERVNWTSGDPVNFGRLNNMDEGIRAVMPVGMILQGWPDPDAPPGFLTCDGSEVARATYPELWAAVDANGWVASGLYGAGDGSTTFELPDIRDRFIKSPASGPGGSVGGSATHSHVNPATGSAGGHSHSNPNVNSNGNHNHGSTSNAGSHNHGGSSGAGTNPISIDAGPGGLNTFNDDPHTHSISSSGSHSHSTNSAGSHAHSQGNTGSSGSHSHNQAPTLSEDHLPPFIELYAIVAT